jgi:hypothetical protein
MMTGKLLISLFYAKCGFSTMLLLYITNEAATISPAPADEKSCNNACMAFSGSHFPLDLFIL